MAEPVQASTPEKRKMRPRGAPANVHEKMARLDILAHKALRFWERTLDDKSNATNAEKIQVSKLVVEYAWGKPKQQVQVDAKVEINHRAQIEALTLLASAANGPIIDANPLNQNAELPAGTNPPLLDARPANPIDPINSALSIGMIEIAGVGGLVGGLVGSEGPPPPQRNPGGGSSTDHPLPLDVKNEPND